MPQPSVEQPTNSKSIFPLIPGRVIPGKNHDGFQYIVNIDDNDKDAAFVQGDKNPMNIGQRVVIIYGNDIRVMPYE